MSQNEVWRFISSQRKMIVALVDGNGYPHATPVWFCARGRRVYFRTQDYKVKARLAQRAGKACCVWEDGTSYNELRGVVMRATIAQVSRTKTIEVLKNELDRKYSEHRWSKSKMPSDWVKERLKERYAYFELTPTRISSWNNSRF